MDKKIIQKPRDCFSDEEKHLIIQELLSCRKTKREIWEKYTGEEEEKGQLLRWMRKLGYNTDVITRRPNFVTNYIAMPKKKQVNTNGAETDFENLQLKKRIDELEKQLRDAELKGYCIFYYGRYCRKRI